MDRKRRRRIKKEDIIRVIVLVVFFIFIFFPFYFMLITSLKPESDILIVPINYFPRHLVFRNYAEAWKDSKFAMYFFNTVIISIFTLILVSAVALMTGYAMSRYTFRGKGFVMTVMLITQIVPSALLLIPLFTIFQSMHLINTFFSVILATSASLLAYCSIMMQGFYSGISVSLEGAAWIDGCSKLQGVILVVFPQLLPGFVATGAYAFVNAWNSFLLPLILLTDPKKFTLTIGLKSLIGLYTINYGRLTAAGIICLIPAVLMFAYIQKYMVEGLGAGAMKG